MKRKFDFILETDYGNSRMKHYITDVIQKAEYKEQEYSKIFVWGNYTTRNNGPNTSCANFYKQYRWPSKEENWFGFHLLKHFKGNNTGLQARKWLNFLLNNTPDYHVVIEGPYCAPDL